MDGAEITINGINDLDFEGDIPDDAEVIINGGYALADEPLYISLETVYKRWKKAQTKTVLVIEIPNDSIEYLKQQITICKGKVIK